MGCVKIAKALLQKGIYHSADLPGVHNALAAHRAL